MTTTAPKEMDGITIMATIGHVCLQWARLEMAILGIIYNTEGISTAHGEIIFGGLDIIPRINMALNLARFQKLSPPILKRIEAVRKALQGGLCDRRNQIVHGAHKDLEGGSTTVTMVRWKGEKRDKTFTAMDIHHLGTAIYELGDECFSIMEAVAAWKLSHHGEKYLANSL